MAFAVSDELLSMIVPIAVHWIGSGIYSIMMGSMQKHRLFTDGEEDAKNLLVTRRQAMVGVLNHALQTAVSSLALVRRGGKGDNNAGATPPPSPLPSLLLLAWQLGVAVMIMDAWQYFWHRWAHENRFLYKHSTPCTTAWSFPTPTALSTPTPWTHSWAPPSAAHWPPSPPACRPGPSPSSSPSSTSGASTTTADCGSPTITPSTPSSATTAPYTPSTTTMASSTTTPTSCSLPGTGSLGRTSLAVLTRVQQYRVGEDPSIYKTFKSC